MQILVHGVRTMLTFYAVSLVLLTVFSFDFYKWLGFFKFFQVRFFLGARTKTPSGTLESQRQSNEVMIPALSCNIPPIYYLAKRIHLVQNLPLLTVSKAFKLT